LTTAAKVRLVAGAIEEFGLGPALAAVDLPRSTWFYQRRRLPYEQRHADVAAVMLKAGATSPEYGYRRLTTEVSESLERPVNATVVRRLAQSLGLTQLRKPRSPKRSAIRRTIDELGDRVNLVTALEEIDLYEVLYTDFTEIVYGGGKAWLIAIIDHDSKDTVGWSLGRSANVDLALVAWRRACRRLRQLGIPIRGLILHQDRDSVFTSERWVRRLLIEDGVRLSYSLRGAKGNTEMESWNGRFKLENADLFAEATDLDELEAVVGARIRYYCEMRRHSTLGNIAPRTYVRRRLKNRPSQ
jgi:putative transposase